MLRAATKLQIADPRFQIEIEDLRLIEVTTAICSAGGPPADFGLKIMYEYASGSEHEDPGIFFRLACARLLEILNGVFICRRGRRRYITAATYRH